MRKRLKNNIWYMIIVFCIGGTSGNIVVVQEEIEKVNITLNKILERLDKMTTDPDAERESTEDLSVRTRLDAHSLNEIEKSIKRSF